MDDRIKRTTSLSIKGPTNPGALARHRIPVIDRMVEVLFALEQSATGVSISDLVDQLRLPRTSLYRILNTLQFHEIVRRSPEGAYRLGPRLLALAARAVDDINLTSISAPHLRRLASETGEGCKLSVIDGDTVLVVAAAEGKREYALGVSPGQRLPLHAGAASKVLMAYLPEGELAKRLAAPLLRYTPKTLTDKRGLAAELAKIRRQGWAHDHGEYSPSIQAFGAPILDGNGSVIAALSVPMLAGTKPAHTAAVRIAVIATARAIAADLPSPRAPMSADDQPAVSRSSTNRAAPARRRQPQPD
jgi:DNA-binding IclR family transcriptional regulator